MKSLIRLLALWLMLVALPFQGFASASMLLCGAGAGAAATALHADHPAMQAASADGGDHSADSTAHCAGSSHGGVMGDCCVAAALAYALPQPAAQPTLAERLRLPEPAAPSPVDLALPKRPPRAILA
jgi:hypothetical protein